MAWLCVRVHGYCGETQNISGGTSDCQHCSVSATGEQCFPSQLPAANLLLSSVRGSMQGESCTHCVLHGPHKQLQKDPISADMVSSWRSPLLGFQAAKTPRSDGVKGLFDEGTVKNNLTLLEMFELFDGNGNEQVRHVAWGLNKGHYELCETRQVPLFDPWINNLMQIEQNDVASESSWTTHFILLWNIGKTHWPMGWTLVFAMTHRCMFTN